MYYVSAFRSTGPSPNPLPLESGQSWGTHLKKKQYDIITVGHVLAQTPCIWGMTRRVLMGLFLYYINSGIVGLSLRIVISRGFQKFNGTPGVEFFILLGFTEPATHVIQACFYIR